MGTVERAWAGLKAKLGGGDHTLLATAEEGEDQAVEAYEKALNKELPSLFDKCWFRKQLTFTLHTIL